MNILGWLFGSGRNVIAETAQVFRPNAENAAQRTADYDGAALGQFAAEFQIERRGIFDRFMDGLNRLPRPMMVLSIFGLFIAAMFDPIWFAARMQGLALVPDPLWWGMGVVVSFYFGGRVQLKSQEFQKSIRSVTASLPQVIENIQKIEALRHDSPGAADTGTDTALSVTVTEPTDNPAVDVWRAGQNAHYGGIS